MADLKVKKSLYENKAKNYEVVELADGRVAYVLDPTKDLGKSASGKTNIVSTTSGALKLDSGLVVSMNAYRK